jgi:diphosphomevalonate decarboxylase
LIPAADYGILLLMTLKATALAHPNIAFIKYWGMKDEDLKLPANDSISMNIGCLSTRTTVEYDQQLRADEIQLNGTPLSGAGLARVEDFMCHLRQMTGRSLFARITSENNFPTGVGIASSASAFAALALAGTAALDLTLSEQELSNLARWGSGSACRSIPGGFVEWRTDPSTNQSYAVSFAPADHWKLMDCIAIVSS